MSHFARTMLAAAVVSSAAAAQTTTPTTTTATTSQAPAFGPSGLLIGVDGEIAIPVGNFSDATGVGIGGYLTGEYKLQPNLSLTGRAGLQLHLSKSFGSDTSSSVQALPILAGVKYYAMSNDRQGLFVVGEAGFNFLYHHIDLGSFGSDSGLDLDIDLGAGAGYQLGALSFKAMIHSMNIAHFGDSLMLTLGAGMQFKGI